MVLWNCFVFRERLFLSKGNAQFIFLSNLQKSSVNVCLKKILKSTVHKKVIVYFYNLSRVYAHLYING